MGQYFEHMYEYNIDNPSNQKGIVGLISRRETGVDCVSLIGKITKQVSDSKPGYVVIVGGDLSYKLVGSRQLSDEEVEERKAKIIEEMKNIESIVPLPDNEVAEDFKYGILESRMTDDDS